MSDPLATDTVPFAVNVTMTGIPPPTDCVEPARDIEASVHAPKLCAKGLALQNIEKEIADFERNHAKDGRNMIEAKKRKADCNAETARHDELNVKTQKLKAVSERKSQAVEKEIEGLQEKKDQNYKIVMERLGKRKEKAESSLRRMQARTYAELGEQLKGTRYEAGIPDSDESGVEVYDAVSELEDSDDDLPPPIMKSKARIPTRPKPKAPISSVMCGNYTTVSRKGEFGKLRSKVGPKK